MFTANQSAIGLRSNRCSDRSRNARIQSGSFFMADISRTIASFKPFFGLKT